MAKGESPLKQFEIQPIVDINFLGFDISFTNSALWMTITTAFILIFFTHRENIKRLKNKEETKTKIY